MGQGVRYEKGTGHFFYEVPQGSRSTQFSDNCGGHPSSLQPQFRQLQAGSNEHCPGLHSMLHPSFPPDGRSPVNLQAAYSSSCNTMASLTAEAVS